jgi:hypothetical protein
MNEALKKLFKSKESKVEDMNENEAYDLNKWAFLKVQELHLLEHQRLIQPEKEEIVSNLYNIDLGKVLQAKGLPDFVKKVAMELTYKPYFTLGYYFSTLSDMEVNMLNGVVSAVETKDTGSVIFSKVEQEQMYKDLLLMGMLLCLASGKGTLTASEITTMKNSLSNFIITEWIFRFKKTHALLRYNWDMFEHDRIIAVPMKGGKGDAGKAKANS